MEATNQPVPVVLSDEQVTEAEQRLGRCVELDSLADVRALCQTVRALRKWNQEGCLQIADLLGERESLREQLAQAIKDRDYWRGRATEASKAAEKWYHERY